MPPTEHRTAWLVPVLALTLATTGCLGVGDDGAGGDGTGSAIGVPPALPFHVPVSVSDQWPGSEPVVDVAPDGTIYYEGIGATPTPTGGTRNVNRVWRSDDGGGTWTDITPPAVGNETTNDGFVAVGPDGAVYAANVFGLTFHILRSSDRGETWVPLNIPRIPALLHRHWIVPDDDGTVHVTVEALPPGAAPFLAGGPSLEDVAATPNEGMWYFRSDDRGDTWSTPLQIDPRINYAGQSNMVVSDDGQHLYVMRYAEDDGGPPIQYSYDDGSFYLLASHDGGDAWTTHELFPLEGAMGSALTSLALDERGALYFVWSEALGGRSVTHVAASGDGGATWTRTRLDLGRGTQAMPFAAALAPGELAIVWYDALADGTTGEVDADWHVRFARVTGATTATPVAAITNVSDVVHQGNICVAGPACGERDGDRRLLDYPWVDVGPDGRVHLAFASTQWDRPSAFPLHAVSMQPAGQLPGS